MGAKVLYGDLDYKINDSIFENGFFFHPMVLENITKNQPAFCEELFGPVFSLFKVHDDFETIELANATCYGLSASIFSQDIDRAKLNARKLEVGNVFINDIVASDPAVPGGGVKDSGYGRECYRDGLHESINRKGVVVGK